MLNLLRKLSGREARQFRRQECAAYAVAKSDDGRLIRGIVLDVSQGGCRFAPEASFLSTKNLEIAVGGVTLDCLVLRKSEAGYHCRFRHKLSKGQMETVHAAIRQARTGVPPSQTAGAPSPQTHPDGRKTAGTTLAEIEARRGRSLGVRSAAATQQATEA